MFPYSDPDTPNGQSEEQPFAFSAAEGRSSDYVQERFEAELGETPLTRSRPAPQRGRLTGPGAAPPVSQILPDVLGGEVQDLEYEQKPASDAPILSFRIPEAPYSDELISSLGKAIDIIGAVDTTMAVFSIEVAGLLGLSLTVGLPFVAFLGLMLSIGGPVAAARAEIARKRVKSGFAMGVVTGADGRKWEYAKRMFWKWSPEFNPFDEDSGKIAQKSFNLGLACGFVQGRKLSQMQRKFFWTSIGRTLTPGERSQFSGDAKSWPDRLWIDWYILAGARFIKLYAKE